MQAAKLVNKPKDKYPMLSNGDIFFVEPTRKGRNTHFYFYDMNGKFLGCLPMAWFDVIVAEDNSDTPNSKTNKRDGMFYEQLSLF